MTKEERRIYGRIYYHKNKEKFKIKSRRLTIKKLKIINEFYPEEDNKCDRYLKVCKEFWI